MENSRIQVLCYRGLLRRANYGVDTGVVKFMCVFTTDITILLIRL